MPWVLNGEGARAVDARLDGAGLLDLAMEEAGRAVADAAQALVPQGPALLLAGSGANGGDAFVAARHLLTLGREALVLALPSRHPLTRLNRRRWRAVGGVTRPLSASAVSHRAPGAGVIVDGLLGTGFGPPLRPALAGVIGALAAARPHGTPVVAIDLPSGLEEASALVPAGPDGQPGTAGADLTVTFMGLKAALLFGAAAGQAGRVQLIPLRVPVDWVQAQAVAEQPTDAQVAALLPVRRADAHKGTAGRVWIVGGQPGTVGAAGMAGVGALRAGAGLVTVHSAAGVPLLMPELMIHRHADLRAALLGTPESGRPDALAVGMGLGPDAAALARELLAWGIPTVLDADALQIELAGHGHAACIWTPHPGEAARLLGTSTRDVTRDPLSAARALQQRLSGVVVLKGGPSVVAYPGGLSVSRGGHPGMASGGMGDTLSGILAALLGQGLSARDAAVTGVRLHARAGERAAQQHGYGLSASDVAQELGGAWQDLSAALPAHRPG